MSRRAAEIGRLAAERKIKPVIGHAFPLAQARAAYELSLRGHLNGKIVITVAEGDRGPLSTLSNQRRTSP